VSTYRFTYWPPGSTGGVANTGTIDAAEFAFTETHVIFLNVNREILLAIPLDLVPIVQLASTVLTA
jgi:hypothetical protein